MSTAHGRTIEIASPGHSGRRVLVKWTEVRPKLLLVVDIEVVLVAKDNHSNLSSKESAENTKPGS